MQTKNILEIIIAVYIVGVSDGCVWWEFLMGVSEEYCSYANSSNLNRLSKNWFIHNNTLQNPPNVSW